MIDDRIGFETCDNPPRLGVAYADAIIAQVELALWELGRSYWSGLRVPEIRRNRRWVSELTVEAASRIVA